MKSFFIKCNINKIEYAHLFYFNSKLKRCSVNIGSTALLIPEIDINENYKFFNDFNMMCKMATAIKTYPSLIKKLPNNLKLNTLTIYRYDNEYIIKDIITEKLFVSNKQHKRIKKETFKCSINFKFKYFNC